MFHVKPCGLGFDATPIFPLQECHSRLMAAVVHPEGTGDGSPVDTLLDGSGKVSPRVAGTGLMAFGILELAWDV